MNQLICLTQYTFFHQRYGGHDSRALLAVAPHAHPRPGGWVARLGVVPAVGSGVSNRSFVAVHFEDGNAEAARVVRENLIATCHHHDEGGGSRRTE